MGAVLSCSKSDNSSIVDDATPVFEDREIDEIVCYEEDLPEEGMKNFKLDEGEILLVKHKDTISAIGAKCTHYGAPLIKGVLSEDGTVRCPWHGACFNTQTGDIEDFPGLDSLPCYAVTLGEKDGDKGRPVRVKTTKSQLLSNKRVKKLAPRDPNNNETIVVVGGGAAGSSCIEVLKQSGFSGKLILISSENSLPYDRPKLSKNMSSTATDIALRPLDYYESAGVDLILGNPVLTLNGETKQLMLKKGETIKYDKVFIATGGVPRSLTIPGSSLDGVMLLRTPSDAQEILERSEKKNVVIIGSSFIGMEVASHLATLSVCKSISVVGTSSVAYKNSLGEEVGGALQALVEKQGVTFYMSDAPLEFRGGSNVEEVILRSGTTLSADVVLCGIGVTPSTEFLEGSKVNLNAKGYAEVNQFLEASVEGVYCGGDIASFPLRYGGKTVEEEVSIGHWQVAQYHGRTAALNMLVPSDGDKVPVDSVPVFWTVLEGKSVRYAGYNAGYDSIEVTGSISGLSFIVHYVKDDKVVAVASMGRDPSVARYAELLRTGGLLTLQQIRENPEYLLSG